MPTYLLIQSAVLNCVPKNHMVLDPEYIYVNINWYYLIDAFNKYFINIYYHVERTILGIIGH